MSDILPLSASVVVVPDLVHNVVEANLPGEASSENGGEHQVVGGEEAPVECVGEGHFDR